MAGFKIECRNCGVAKTFDDNFENDNSIEISTPYSNSHSGITSINVQIGCECGNFAETTTLNNNY
ncbi:hypothetical protein [Brevibacillus laterosporus]|uniref:Uncharacterized protein n=1 Tax=Brevibacillus laterosporus TaxID=1465 RepID=A0AAP3DL32_BRELA|nr:hypothetical protein [Brevibacillus laterosporus]MCR8982645.1 hypothetical protein [Brevibacillus laterosporus]MCZ0809801.1 hypothetical protein [Brevibacillus laterosporus]MCZ0828365.1 hypothetical protein [Brevibacillus laterosporus]MCZ0852375.1 hypothetical protein [Brevibacillus laterosporus]